MERVDLNGQVYAEPRADRQCWRNGDPWDPATTTVIVGELPGRWYARWFGRGPLPSGGCVYVGPKAEHYARGAARRWMRTIGGTWSEA